MAEEKTAEKAEYYKWLDLSEDERSLILTEDAYSKSTGVSRTTLIKWKKQRDTGEFDMRGAFLENQEKIWNGFLGAVKSGKINAQLFRTFAQLANELVEKKEETVKLEYSSNEIARDSEEFIRFLADELKKNGGTCPICGKSHTLLAEVCSN